jgi:lactate dehydrogenase-like 2-hydroxyacid dehydrogenase
MNPHPFLLEHLKSAYTLHQRLHETDPAAFAEVAPRIRAISASGESKVSAALIAQLPKLEIISVMGVGYDGVDVAAAKGRGVMVTHTPNVLNDDVADLAIALMLAWSRQLPRADRFVRAGEWSNGPLSMGRKMSGARIGIVGMGRIGQAIAHRAAAFGMSIAYTARSKKADLPYAYFPTATALASNSDYLVAITPGGAETRKLINAEVLKALGPQGCVVNVARGSVIDESALIAALQAGTIAGAALDVFESEPNAA